jgi:peptide/nickel transport system substrate-binding protein/oligopeptide transport system substrate-binding protein
MLRSARLCLLPVLMGMAAACSNGNDGPVQVAVIGDASALQTAGPRLSAAARMIRAATVEGLVGFDAEGRVGSGLADRWIVAEDGRSYIFRLRDGTWPDGSRITGETAAVALRRALAALRGTALGLDLSPIEAVRVMADRVIEIDLVAPMPDLLTLMAQPELGMVHERRGSGPMALRRDGAHVILSLIPPEQSGLPAQADFAERARTLDVVFLSAEKAVARFNDGYADVVLGGRIDSLTLANVSGLSRGNVQLDPVIGMFGLMVDNDMGFLANPSNREALAMAIDREGILGSFNIGGWQPTTRIVSADVEDDLGTVGERWLGMTLNERRAAATQRVARWTSTGNPPVALRLAMPAGPGSVLVFNRLKEDMAAIGVSLQMAGERERADLRMVDSVARYGRATWFLNQLACSVQRAACSPVGDDRLAEARRAIDPEQRAALLAEAEAEMTASNGYIPIGRPLRWSMVRSGVTGFALNPWGWHPLPPVAMLPK